MEKTLLLSIAAVFCFVTCITSANEVSEVDMSISQREGTYYTPMDTVLNKKLPFSGSEFESNQANGPPESPQNCTITNQSFNSISLSCDIGDDGGSEQTFHLEVYSMRLEQLLTNVTSDENPSFTVNGLSSGNALVLIVYSSNSNGRSPSVVLTASTLYSTERQTECKCKNGKCMRVCDVEKTTPCTDERKVCVCNPEFGKKGEGECEYCDCGQGFNCTFELIFGEIISDYWRKTCICPKGYYNNIVGKCKPECSDEQPCQNGGECSSYKRCSCPWGDKIEGDLCEEVVECKYLCQNRLEVDCLYNRPQGVTYCSCKNSSLYYDEKADICKPCPCENGYCDYEYGIHDRKLKCHCHNGYKLFNGNCKKCDCGSGANGECEFDSKGEKICKCLDGFYEREGRCYICGCKGSSDTDTKCKVFGNRKSCFCPEGYEEVLGHCEDINECETANTCSLSATCYNTVGSFYCQCPDGYRGIFGNSVVEPGEVCEDIDECKESPIACWYRDNVKCVNLEGSYKCECLKGYEPSSQFDEPHRTTCVTPSKNDGPAVIVVFTTLILMAVACWVHVHVKRRAARSN